MLAKKDKEFVTPNVIFDIKNVAGQKNTCGVQQQHASNSNLFI